MKLILRTIPSLVALVIIVLFLYFYSLSHVKFAEATSNVAIYAPVNSGSTLCGNASSTLVVATSTTGRNMMLFSNDSAQAIYLGLGTAAVADKGVMVSASSTIRFDSNASFAGSIYCTSKGATASTSWSDSQS